MVPIMGTCYDPCMRIIARKTLRAFWEDHADAEQPLKAWYAEAKKASWRTPHAVKEMYRNASMIGDNKVVFNIAGNKYRVAVKFNYELGIGFILFVGTHKEYDTVDLEKI